VDGFDVLPVFLEEGNEKVDGKDDVGLKFFGLHEDIANRAGHIDGLLQLEFDGHFGFVDLAGEVVVVGDGGGELSGSLQRGAHQTRQLDDDSIGGEEHIVRLVQFLGFLCIWLSFVVLHVVDADEGNRLLLRLIAVNLIADDAHPQLSLAEMWQHNRSCKTLVLRGIISLQSHLQFDALRKLSLLLLGCLQDAIHGLSQDVGLDFAHFDQSIPLIAFGFFGG